MRMTSETDAKIRDEGRRRHRYVIKRYQSSIGWSLVVGLVLTYSGYITPQNTYIRCDDITINHEQNKDSISVSLLLVVSLIVPFALMTIIEWFNNNQLPTESPFVKGFRKAYRHFLSLLVGCLFCFFVVEVLKTAVSEPRPHFMKTCSPNLTQEQCQQPWIHVTWENCQNPHNLSFLKLLDVMKSFPSGHASIGIFSAVFMTIFIHQRVRVKWSNLLIVWLHLIWWTWALLCCASRVWDKRHHWWDVLAGAIIGGIAAYATVAHLCLWFDSERKPTYHFEERTETVEGGESPRQRTPLRDHNGHYGQQIVAMEEHRKEST